MSRRNSRTIYVGNLPGDIRLREVEDLFCKYGPIVDIDLKIPPRPPGHAFVEFEDVRDAEDAIYGRDGYKFDGLRLRVEFAHGGRGHSSSVDRYSSYSRSGSSRGGVSKRTDYRVFVTGLPPSASWQDLNDHMRRAGDVCFCEVFRDRSGMVGIVDYTNYDDMKYAIRKLDSEFRNAFSRSYLRVKEYDSRRSYSRSPSCDSRSDYSRSPSLSPYKSRYRSRSRSFSRSPSDTGRNPRFILVFLQNLTFFDYFLRFEHFHFSMKHIIKILTLLVAISALWIGLLQTSIVPHGHAWLLPIYFIVLLGCYGLLMVGVELMRFPTCPGEGLLLQQDIDEAKKNLKQRVVVDISFD